MSDLLQTRLGPPRTAGPRLRRGQLLERMAEVRVVALEGPAGSGKSSLLYDHCLESSQPFAWYSADPADAGPGAFLRYVIEAVHRVAPGAAARARTLAAVPAEASWPSWLAALINDLAAAGTRLRLVLDDLHLVAGHPEVREALRTLVTAGPDNLGLLLASRSPLDLPLARLQLHQEAVVLTSEDLAFTPGEVRRVFTEAWGLPLDRSATQQLSLYTGGWAAGLSLLRQALARRWPSGSPEPGELRDYLRQLPSRRLTLFRFVLREILAGRPPEVLEFLRATCVLEEFDEDSARWMSGQAEARRVLEGLDGEGLLLVRLEGETASWRYHHLFSSLLQHLVRREAGAGHLRRLHRRAARHYRRRGQAERAVEHATLGRAWTRAAALLAEHGEALASRGFPVSTWIRRLPPSRRHSPPLLLVEGAGREFACDWKSALERYREALRHYRRADDAAGVARALEMMAVCLARYGDREPMLAFIDEASRYCPADRPDLEARIQVWLGGLMIYVGVDVPRGYEVARRGFALARQVGQPQALAGGYIAHAFMANFARGRFGEAADLLLEGRDLFRREGQDYFAFHLEVDLALTHLVEGDLEAAEASIERCGPDSDRFRGTWVDYGHGVNRAMLSLRRGRPREARRILDELESGEVPFNIQAFYRRARVLACLAEGDLPGATREARAMVDVVERQGRTGYYAPECLLALCALQARAGDLEAARATAREVLATAQAQEMEFWVIKASVFLAWLEPGEDEHLSRALRGGYRAFWRSDPVGVARPLLERALARGIEVDRARERLADLAAAPPQAAGLLSPEALEAPLLKVRVAEAPTVRVLTLGGFRVLSRGRPLPPAAWRRKRVLALFKFLLSRKDGSALLDEALEAFWPGADPVRSRHYLSVHVYGIRAALGLAGLPDGGPVQRVGDAYRIVAGPDMGVDWMDFERLVGEARREPREDRARRRLLEAVRLYRGEFLPEDAYADWTRERRARLADLHLEALLRLGDHDLARGRTEEGLAWLLQAATARPESPAVCRRRMEACHRAGDRPGARRAWEDFRSALDGEEPDAETSLLARQILGD